LFVESKGFPRITGWQGNCSFSDSRAIRERMLPHKKITAGRRPLNLGLTVFGGGDREVLEAADPSFGKLATAKARLNTTI